MAVSQMNVIPCKAVRFFFTLSAVRSTVKTEN